MFVADLHNDVLQRAIIGQDIITHSNQGHTDIDRLIEMAGNFADEFDISDDIEIEIDSKTKDALGKLVALLEKDEEIEDLQNTIYQIAKGGDIEPKEFFKVLYQIILSTTRGPKIGPFILDIGKKNVAEKISKYVK